MCVCVCVCVCVCACACVDLLFCYYILYLKFGIKDTSTSGCMCNTYKVYCTVVICACRSTNNIYNTSGTFIVQCVTFNKVCQLCFQSNV